MAKYDSTIGEIQAQVLQWQHHMTLYGLLLHAKKLRARPSFLREASSASYPERSWKRNQNISLSV
jgi:hypothetical protein